MGHNLHQYLYRGTPRRLPEAMRHKLAELLNVKEESLREEEVSPRPASFLCPSPFLPRLQIPAMAALKKTGSGYPAELGISPNSVEINL